MTTSPPYRRKLGFRNRRIKTFGSAQPSPQADRFSQLVSLISVAGLLCTVVFGYLSWRESRQARQELAAAFSAEKAPQLTLVSAHVLLGGFSAEFQNTGESVALTVSATLTGRFTAGNTTQDAKPSAAHSVASIRKGQTVTVPIQPSAVLAAALGPRVGALVSIGTTPFLKARPERFVVLTANYEDTFGNKYQDAFQLIAPAE